MSLARRALTLAVLALSLAFAACRGASDSGPKPAQPTQSTPQQTGATSVSANAATLSGTMTVDGTPVDAQFAGARVLRDGLAAACQDEIPSVGQGGRYQMTVAADDEVKGCGADGAEIVLWYYDNGFVFSNGTTPWPGDGESALFDASFSSASPQGAADRVSEFKGHLFASGGTALPGGTVVEAYIGDVLCGVTSLRRDDSTEGFYTLDVSGPEMKSGCDAGATISFKLDGRPARETATNDFGEGRDPNSVLDLTLK